jgi:hypothetical protein
MTPEHRLQNEIKLWCGEHNIICLRINVGKVKTVDGRWFDTGLPVGFSDLLLLSADGKATFVETKIKPRKPTEQQIQFIQLMKNRGFNAFVAYSLQEFIERYMHS